MVGALLGDLFLGIFGRSGGAARHRDALREALTAEAYDTAAGQTEVVAARVLLR